jgi:hypothetical protein
VLDGRPDGPIVGNPNGARSGIAAPGPDVGYYASSVRLNNAFVTLYQDASREVLKAAVSTTESVQSVYDLDATTGSGYGADLIVDSSNDLHAAYLTRTAAGAATLFYAHSGSQKNPPLTAQSWNIQPVAELGGAPGFEKPCDGQCTVTEVCVTTQASPECKTADLVSTCDPSCGHGSLCVGGLCRAILRATAGVLPWRDEPGGDSAIALWGSERLIAFHDHFSGALKLARAPNGQAFTVIHLDGGGGHDVGHQVAIATASSGLIAIAYQDSTTEAARLLTGFDPSAMSGAKLGTGGLGIAMRFSKDGVLYLAYGQADTARVRLWYGQPSQLQEIDGPKGGAVGRFNALLLNADKPLLATLRDNLTQNHKVNPKIELVVLPNN